MHVPVARVVRVWGCAFPVLVGVECTQHALTENSSSKGRQSWTEMKYNIGTSINH